MPPEVLEEIFWQCLPERRYPTTSFREAPLLLTHVCRQWRDVAISSPRLWSSIYISWTDGGAGRDIYNRSSGPTLESQIIHRRCDLVEQWISRSGFLPLSLYLNYIHDEDDRTAQTDAEVNIRMVTILISQIYRWANATMIMPVEIYNKFDAALSVEEPYMLRTLDIRGYFTRSGAYWQPTKPGMGLLSAPNLQKLSIAGMAFTMPTCSPCYLTNLNCQVHPFHHEEALGLLSRLPALIHCKMLISVNLTQEFNAHSTVSLPYLQSLVILDNGDVSNPIKVRFYSCFDAPSLKWLSDGRLNHVVSSPDIFNNGPGNLVAYGPDYPPMVLIKRCNLSLKRLSFEHYGLSPSVIQEIFQKLPYLSHIEIGHDYFYGHDAIYQTNEELDTSMSYENLDIDTLIVDASGEEISGAEHQVYLPNLTVFVARGVRKWTDESVLRFALSRLNPSISGRGIATLKSIHVSFARDMIQDIESTILQYAKEKGIDVDLKLQYHTHPSYFNYTASTYYGVPDDIISTSPFYMHESSS